MLMSRSTELSTDDLSWICELCIYVIHVDGGNGFVKIFLKKMTRNINVCSTQHLLIA